MVKKHRLIVLCLFLFIVATSCDKMEKSSGAGPSTNRNILRFDVAAPFTSLNPAEADASGSTIIFPLLYSYLCVPDSDGELKPDLAESWTYDPKTFTWIIHLRTDAVFHNGRPVTATDVQYSIETILKNLRPAMVSSIRQISVMTEKKLVITLFNEDSDFLKKIWFVEIIPHSGYDFGQANDLPIGSGPFKFDARISNEQVVLTGNKNYYGGPPSLDAVVYIYQPDKEKSWTRLLSGATDIAQEISPKNFEIMQQYERQFYFNHYTLEYYSILLYNTNSFLFSNPQVRRALTYAIDREYIVKNILNGYGKVAIGPMGIDSPFHNPELTPIPYDPKKSLELLRQAGWVYHKNDNFLYKDGRCFEFTLLVLKESQVEKNVAQYIKLCLNDIGIQMNVQLFPLDELYLRYNCNNKFQAVLTEFTGCYRQPEFLKEVWTPYLSEKSGAGGFEDPEVTRLLNKAIKEKDPVKQKTCLYKVDSLIASLQPGTFLFHKTAIDVMSKRFALPYSFSLSHEGIFYLQYASLVQK